MPYDCQNTISTPESPDFKSAITPFLSTRFLRVTNYVDYGTHDDHVEAVLPCGIPHVKRTIDLDFEKIIPMPESIQRTRKEEFSEDTPKGMALREENRVLIGFEDWYDWSWEHWGTKWNSYDGRFFKDDTAYLFSTAWNPPFPIMRKLAHLLNSPVQLEYFDYAVEGRALFLPDGEMEHTKKKW